MNLNIKLGVLLFALVAIGGLTAPVEEQIQDETNHGDTDLEIRVTQEQPSDSDLDRWIVSADSFYCMFHDPSLQNDPLRSESGSNPEKVKYHDRSWSTGCLHLEFGLP